MTRALPHAAVAVDSLWFKDAVIYQLHVKSFFDANDDGIGDFPGLIQKLDYLVELGVTALWLLPFYPSPRRDDGYDIAEYENVHPDYGTLDDVRRFIEEAHLRGLRVITELVINHTSDQHPWFQRARRAPKGSPERDFYVWSDSDKAYDGTRIIFCDTEKSNWTWDPVAEQYYWHRFYSHQPDLNFDNPAVLDAVLQVMQFWLDQGVDGLRLDAVPYLIEREGTNNENLPETHGILKKIRAHMEGTHPDRMLLAEANQWPEDTQEYFGAGDECHMAFHFPLMPRMYMAIAREDRFPITDILRQTPAIPETCQWAIFLRNHDELTLEMVTDDERDYLWETYASDKRARINLGIRRRLAPLLERDRRRIELMTSLLLTMPGTPVLYYGDELGMGDNIHLGDRDGVRTPMQWSMDRNGGFSRADPAGLVLPAIMDPLYGFHSVNVEAQKRDAHSLLNWTRRMLAARARFSAFGRGTLRLLYPSNRRVMAYLRELGDETLLCVANLSRSLQAVELDLGEFDGRVPLDIFAGNAFPPIGQLPYLLTLPPYGVYIFQLAGRAALPDWHTPAPEPLPEYRTLVLRGTLEQAPRDALHQILDGDALPAYLPKRRWFDKSLPAAQARLEPQFTLPGSNGDVVWSTVHVERDGEEECYQLPLGVAWNAADASALPQQLALAQIRRGRNVGHLTDAFALREFVVGVVRGIRDGLELEDGRVRFLNHAPERLAGLSDEPSVRWIAAEHSNSAVIVDEAVVLKLVRHIERGVHPEAEIGRALRQAGFNATAPLLGDVTRTLDDGTPVTLALLQEYVPNQGDAWHYTLEYLRRRFEACAAAEMAVDCDAPAPEFDGVMTQLGRRLAELHAALASAGGDDFAPVRVDADTAAAWKRALQDEIDRTVAALAEHDAPAALQARIAGVREAAAAALPACLDELSEAAVGSWATRVHGDFHLGQVLVSRNDAYLIDFEGEPGRPLGERRSKASPLRDVAGLLRSIDYVASVAGDSERTLARVPDDGAQLLLERFRERTSRLFLDGYRERTAELGTLADNLPNFEPLVRFFLIEKACYELRYELAQRPDWLGIPLRGIERLLGERDGA